MEISANPEEVKKRIRIIRYIHYAVFWLFFVCFGLVIFSQDLGLYGAVAMLGMGAVQYSNAGRCPLTIEEHKALKSVGAVPEHNFIEGVFKKYFNIDIPRYVVDTPVIIAYAMSIYVFLFYLINAFSNI